MQYLKLQTFLDPRLTILSIKIRSYLNSNDTTENLNNLFNTTKQKMSTVCKFKRIKLSRANFIVRHICFCKKINLLFHFEENAHRSLIANMVEKRVHSQKVGEV